MRRVGGLVMLIPNGSPAHLFSPDHLLSSVRERYANAYRRARLQVRARVQSRALASDRLASDPEEGSIAPLIVGMLALLLLIGSVTVAITGAYLQTQHLQDMADAQANSITRTMRTPDEASGSAAWGMRARTWLRFSRGRIFRRCVWRTCPWILITVCMCTSRLVFVRRWCRFWCLMVLR